MGHPPGTASASGPATPPGRTASALRRLPISSPTPSPELGSGLASSDISFLRTPSSWSPAPASLREALAELVQGERLARLRARAQGSAPPPPAALAPPPAAPAPATGAVAAAGAGAAGVAAAAAEEGRPQDQSKDDLSGDAQLQLWALDAKVSEVADTFHELVTVVSDVCQQVSALAATVAEQSEVDGLAAQLSSLKGRMEVLQPRGVGGSAVVRGVARRLGESCVHQASPPQRGTADFKSAGPSTGAAPPPRAAAAAASCARPAAASSAGGSEGAREEKSESSSEPHESDSLRLGVDQLAQVVERLGKGLRVLALRTEQLEDDLPRAEDLERRLRHVEQDMAKRLKEFKCSLSGELEELTLCLRLFRNSLLQRSEPPAGGATAQRAAGTAVEPHAASPRQRKGRSRRFVLRPSSADAAADREAAEVLGPLADAAEQLEQASRRAERVEQAFAAEVDRCCSAAASPAPAPSLRGLAHGRAEEASPPPRRSASLPRPGAPSTPPCPRPPRLAQLRGGGPAGGSPGREPRIADFLPPPPPASPPTHLGHEDGWPAGGQPQRR